jgi:hypothetical protein
MRPETPRLEELPMVPASARRGEALGSMRTASVM